MKHLLTALILLGTLNVHAWTLESKVQVGSKGEFSDTVTLFCRADESLCETVCGDKNSCHKEQELCFNCLGTANPILRTVFTEVDRLYRNTLQAVPVQNAAKVFKSSHVFVAARSIYNFYSAIDSVEVQTRFQNLCPSPSAQPLLVLEKNLNNEPTRIKYVICDGVGPYNQEMQVLEYSPRVESGAQEIKLNQP